MAGRCGLADRAFGAVREFAGEGGRGIRGRHDHRAGQQQDPAPDPPGRHRRAESQTAVRPGVEKSLSDLVLGKSVSVERRKEDNYGRVVGRVMVQPTDCPTCPRTRDAGLAQLEAGLAWWYRQERREQSLEEQAYYEYAEFDARARRIGLWRDAAPIPPWEWRKRENKVSVQANASLIGVKRSGRN